MAIKTKTTKATARSSKTAKSARPPWFVAVRGSYLPRSWQGYIIYFVYMVYIVMLPVIWYQKGHELWQFVSVVVPFMLGAVLVTHHVAARHSDKDN